MPLYPSFRPLPDDKTRKKKKKCENNKGREDVSVDRSKQKKDAIRVPDLQSEEFVRIGDEVQVSSGNRKVAVKEIPNLTTPTEVTGSQMRQTPSIGHSSEKKQGEVELLGRDPTAKRQLQWPEMIERDGMQGVWAKTDTNKFKAPSGKLQFIPPKEVAGQSIAQMQMEDVKTEAEYWESSIACFVLGAHPPIGVMERYFHKLWGNLGIDKVILLPSGLFVVRFTTLNARDTVLNVNFYHFGSKPLIVKPRDVEKGINYNDVEYGLEVKFWNLNCLSRLVSAIGTPILADDYTVRKERVQFARVLVEVKIAAAVPDKLVFEDEKGNVKDEGRNNAAKTIATDDNQRNPIVRRKDQSSSEMSTINSNGQPATSFHEEGNLEKIKGVQSGEVENVKRKMFTWCNQRVGTERIYAKLDRALVNGEWIDQYAESIATVLMKGVSDHSPLEVQFKVEMQKRRSAFRFFNMWCLSTDFQRTVERSWAEKVEGTCMYQLCQKLKSASFWEVEAKSDASWQWKQLLKVRDQGKLGFAGSRWLASSNGKYTVKSGKIAASEARWRMQILNMWKGQKIKRRLLWAVIAACTYQLWEERNRRHFQQLERSPEQIMLLIKDEMRGRFLYCHKMKNRAVAAIFDRLDHAECVLCQDNVEESASHLFFECGYSEKLLNGVKEWLHLELRQKMLQQLVIRIKNVYRYQKMEQKLACGALMACVYHIWMERNARRFQQKQKQEEVRLVEIKKELMYRVQCISSKLKAKTVRYLDSITSNFV
ncbi:OLC1v1008308C1 [Oldenlandia corymbosa var. corymbosa]|uniref:OLC1v1008308C1 n=1 Tax=Oldenlandia corymbosa var. corymbosa TaxID=529605 RepID=A0AAV1DL87_OLDCO|nr:OLC1v1008308C1 [Oldenlandia corymbosa var. corymbosa]